MNANHMERDKNMCMMPEHKKTHEKKMLHSKPKSM
jgi:hypothetical protein